MFFQSKNHGNFVLVIIADVAIDLRSEYVSLESFDQNWAEVICECCCQGAADGGGDERRHQFFYFPVAGHAACNPRFLVDVSLHLTFWPMMKSPITIFEFSHWRYVNLLFWICHRWSHQRAAHPSRAICLHKLMQIAPLEIKRLDAANIHDISKLNQ